jgi:NAD(P)-dependent dehydrogenase (short-subunit alcohol dehydrogenase family)
MPVADGRVALVTGSSRGLGAVIARRLAGDGFAVAVNGRRGDGHAQEVSRAIRGDGGVAEAFGADITDEQQVAEQFPHRHRTGGILPVLTGYAAVARIFRITRKHARHSCRSP